MRTTLRTYTWDANGQRKLAKVTEEGAYRTSASGDVRVVSTTSDSDLNEIFRLCNARSQIQKRQAQTHRRRKPRFISGR